ncbi:Ser/Thr-rich protein T10 in DGCR region [Theobroma cacao]|uniref:Ser/Thr-rich protein T10 in DGCR region n=1 Tax=Theobroma cacao TaxID=3641 RepID=A0A061FLC3_THECC|nr:Ser/Thr-rich protein T10 in DGCR region [Theobroma cacao]
MCIAAFVWQAHPLYPLLLLHNRDEYHNRPTTPVAWWDDGSGILGGRDEVAGGTWLACSKQGRVAFLTNVLELHTLPEAKSRGDLPVLFLESTKSPMEFAEELVKEAHQYNGFNLILADIPSKSMVYASNRPKGEPVSIQQVSPGLHVLSNAKIDSPWHKAQRLGKNFKQMLNKLGKNEVIVKEMVEKLMKDKVKADKSKLPGICALDWEFNLSSIFVEVDTPLGLYGTRSTAALTIHAGGEVAFYEKYLEKDMWKERTINYHIQKVK